MRLGLVPASLSGHIRCSRPMNRNTNIYVYKVITNIKNHDNCKIKTNTNKNLLNNTNLFRRIVKKCAFDKDYNYTNLIFSTFIVSFPLLLPS